MSKAKPGTPLGAISHRTFNTLIDAGEAFKQTLHSIGVDPKADDRRADIVLVKNASGADCPRFGVLGIDGPIFGPADNLNEFKNRIALKCVTPTTAASIDKR